MSGTPSRSVMPVVILVLLAALVTVFSLYVVQLAKQQTANPSEVAANATGNGAQFRWKMVTTWPKNFPGLGRAPEVFAERVSAMSNGRLQIKVYGAGELVPALGVFDAVSSGSVEMGHGAAYYWKGKIPAAQFFTAVPFGMNAQEMNGWLSYGGGLQLWQEVYEPFNLVPFPAGNTGVQMAGWFNKEINSIDDLTGLKMRIPGLGGEVLNRAGGTAVNIPGGELYTALQTGVIDATEWVGPYNDLAFGFHQVAKYYYYPGWHEPGPTLELLVNKKAYASLPKDLQSIVAVAAQSVNQDMLDEYTARNNEAMKELVEKHGVVVKRLPDDVLATLKQNADALYAEMAANDPLVDRVYSAYKAFADKAANYHNYSERPYYNIRLPLEKPPHN